MLKKRGHNNRPWLVILEVLATLDDEKMMADFDRWFIPIVTIVVLVTAAIIFGHSLYWIVSGG